MDAFKLLKLKLTFMPIEVKQKMTTLLSLYPSTMYTIYKDVIHPAIKS